MAYNLQNQILKKAIKTNKEDTLIIMNVNIFMQLILKQC